MCCATITFFVFLSCPHSDSSFFVELDLIGILDSNTTLEEINLSGNMIDSGVLEEIYALLNKGRKSKSKEKNHPYDRQSKAGRSSSDDGSDDESLSSIVERINSNDPSLTQLLLDNRHLGCSHETENLFDALSKNTYVNKISLRNNEIDDRLIAALSLALADNTAISHVFLSDNVITSEGCEYVSFVLRLLHDLSD